MCLRVDTALDADHDLLGVFRVLLEVTLKQDETVVVWRAIELAAVPEVAWFEMLSMLSLRSFAHRGLLTSIGQSRAHGLEGLLL
jgi:hypothetical protein